MENKGPSLTPFLVGLALAVGIAVGLGTPPLLKRLSSHEETSNGNHAVSVNVAVEVIQAQPKMTDSFELPAVVEPNRVVRVAAEVAGRVESVRCDEGTVCREGDPLVDLNTELLQAEFDRAKAAAHFAETEYERIVRLKEQGAGTPQDRDRAEYEMYISRAMMERAGAELERAKIIAPINGVLNDVTVEKGEYVQPGDPVAEMVDIDSLKVVAPVSELDIPYIKVGDPAEVFPNVNGNGDSITCTVTYISARSDESTRATRVELALDNKDRARRSGRIVKVRLTRRFIEGAIMIPLDAAIPLEEGNAVYVVEKDLETQQEVARRRTVKLDPRFIKRMVPPRQEGDTEPRPPEQRILVLSGLNEGERLIVSGHQFVGAGQPVTIRERETMTESTAASESGPSQ